MEQPLELTFTDMPPSEFVERNIRERVAKLERLFDRITSCHVYVAAPHKRHQKGNHFEIRIEVRVPGTELVVNNQPGDVHAHEDIHVAIRDAFNAMERQLKKHKAKRSGDVKSSVASGQLQGQIKEIDHERGFGQIIAADGRLVYFHANSVVDGTFDALAEGDPVLLVVQSDESPTGPQASTVKPISETRFRAPGMAPANG
jgi:ribosomal subunit interface protein